MRKLTMLLGVLALAAMAAVPAFAQSDEKVEVCHKPGTPAEHSIEVNQNALGAHEAHGDSVGECEEAADEGQYEDSAGDQQYAGEDQYEEDAGEDQYGVGGNVEGNAQSNSEVQYGGANADVQNNVSAGGDVQQNFFFDTVEALFG